MNQELMKRNKLSDFKFLEHTVFSISDVVNFLIKFNLIPNGCIPYLESELSKCTTNRLFLMHLINCRIMSTIAMNSNDIMFIWLNSEISKLVFAGNCDVFGSFKILIETFHIGDLSSKENRDVINNYILSDNEKTALEFLEGLSIVDKDIKFQLTDEMLPDLLGIRVNYTKPVTVDRVMDSLIRRFKSKDVRQTNVSLSIMDSKNIRIYPINNKNYYFHCKLDEKNIDLIYYEPINHKSQVATLINRIKLTIDNATSYMEKKTAEEELYFLQRVMLKILKEKAKVKWI